MGGCVNGRMCKFARGLRGRKLYFQFISMVCGDANQGQNISINATFSFMLLRLLASYQQAMS